MSGQSSRIWAQQSKKSENNFTLNAETFSLKVVFALLSFSKKVSPDSNHQVLVLQNTSIKKKKQKKKTKVTCFLGEWGSFMARVNTVLQGFIQFIGSIKNIWFYLSSTFPELEKVRISEVMPNSFCILQCGGQHYLSSRLVVQLSDWLIQSLHSSLLSMLH